MKKIFISPLYADVKIKVDDEIINAHKIILSFRNEVFRNMQESNMLESNTNIIEIKDFDTKTVKLFLKYLYTSELDEITEDLLRIADKYVDQKLKKICQDELCKNINVENVVSRLLIAIQCNCENLKNKSSIFIAQNFDKVRERPEFALTQIDLYNEALLKIISGFISLNTSKLI